MAPVEFEDYTVKVTGAMDDALLAGLEAAAGEIESMTIRNSRQGHTYGDIQARALWEHRVDEGKKEARVGSQHEAAYWEEFGTGEHALYGNGRKGWWVYIEGQDSGTGGQSYTSREEAEEAADFLRRVKGLDAVATNGQDPNRPLFRAFSSGKSIVQEIIQDHLKGMD